jgi:hypothetical protein
MSPQEVVIADAQRKSSCAAMFGIALVNAVNQRA